MRTGTNLSIQDYFRQSGLKPTADRSAGGAIEVSNADGDSFSRVLAVRQSSVNTQHRGLTIRDYMDKPVVIRRSFPQGLSVQPPGGDASLAVSRTPTVEKHPPSIAAPAPDAPRPGANVHPLAAIDVKDQIETSIRKAAKRYDLPTPLIRAVVRAESDYQVRAVSPAGAQGLMQLMPGTAREMGVVDPFDVDQNIDGGAKYLRTMMDRFDGDVKLALSAYNAGPGTVAKYNGHVPFAETRNYVDRVMRFARLRS